MSLRRFLSLAASPDALRRIAYTLGMALTLSACGYKGPLYLPPPPAPQESLTTPPSDSEIPSVGSAQTVLVPETPVPDADNAIQ